MFAQANDVTNILWNTTLKSF